MLSKESVLFIFSSMKFSCFTSLKDAEIAAAEESHAQLMKVMQHKMKNLMGEHEDIVCDLQVKKLL